MIGRKNVFEIYDADTANPNMDATILENIYDTSSPTYLSGFYSGREDSDVSKLPFRQSCHDRRLLHQERERRHQMHHQLRLRFHHRKRQKH